MNNKMIVNTLISAIGGGILGTGIYCLVKQSLYLEISLILIGGAIMVTGWLRSTGLWEE